MVRQLEAEMGSDIEGLTWMSPATKKEALVKLNGILNKIGYPDKWRDYSALRILPEDFAGNVKRADDSRKSANSPKIGKPTDRAEWL